MLTSGGLRRQLESRRARQRPSHALSASRSSDRRSGGSRLFRRHEPQSGRGGSVTDRDPAGPEAAVRNSAARRKAIRRTWGAGSRMIRRAASSRAASNHARAGEASPGAGADLPRRARLLMASGPISGPSSSPDTSAGGKYSQAGVGPEPNRPVKTGGGAGFLTGFAGPRRKKVHPSETSSTVIRGATGLGPRSGNGRGGGAATADQAKPTRQVDGSAGSAAGAAASGVGRAPDAPVPASSSRRPEPGPESVVPVLAPAVSEGARRRAASRTRHLTSASSAARRGRSPAAAHPDPASRTGEPKRRTISSSQPETARHKC